MAHIAGWSWDHIRNRGIVTKDDEGVTTAHRFTDQADCSVPRLEAKLQAQDDIFAVALTISELLEK